MGEGADWKWEQPGCGNDLFQIQPYPARPRIPAEKQSHPGTIRAVRPWSFPDLTPHGKSSPPRRIGRGSLLRLRFSTQLIVEPREHAVPSVTTGGGERVVVTGSGNLHPRFRFGRFREQFPSL